MPEPLFLPQAVQATLDTIDHIGRPVSAAEELRIYSDAYWAAHDAASTVPPGANRRDHIYNAALTAAKAGHDYRQMPAVPSLPPVPPAPTRAPKGQPGHAKRATR